MEKETPTPSNPNDEGMMMEGDVNEDDLYDDDEKQDPEMIRLAELLKEASIQPKNILEEGQDDDEDRDINNFVRELGAMNVKEKK